MWSGPVELLFDEFDIANETWVAFFVYWFRCQRFGVFVYFSVGGVDRMFNPFMPNRQLIVDDVTATGLRVKSFHDLQPGIMIGNCAQRYASCLISAGIVCFTSFFKN